MSSLLYGWLWISCAEISDVRFRCGQVRIETGAEDADALSEFDARNALYGVFLQHLLATFRENAEVRRDQVFEAHDLCSLCVRKG